MRKFIIFGLVITLLLIGTAVFVSAQDNESGGQRDSVAVTIYNQGTALVQDRRTFAFQAGENTINFTDVAASIDPTSVTFVSLTDPAGTTVLEQNFIYDLVNSYAL